jgi:signal transduction protein with GAF and PtsI domain
MDTQALHHETLVKITNNICSSREPDDVLESMLKSISSALNVKGCALFIVDSNKKELQRIASFGLSNEYLNKGPLSTSHSIPDSLNEPVLVHSFVDDPGVQYPEAAKKEGIASILSVPIYTRIDVVGLMRVYSSQEWEFSSEDITFVQDLAQMAGMLIERSKMKWFQPS